MGDPSAAAGAKNGFDSGDQSAGRFADFHRPSFARVNVGLAIRHDEESPVFQSGLNVYRKPVGGPHRLSGRTQTSFEFRGRPGAIQAFGKRCDFASERAEEFEIGNLDAR